MMTLIGLVGKKQSGKDTFCAMLSQLSPLPVQRLAFGDALKQEVAGACDVPVHTIEQHKATFRPMLQWWGTEFRRQLFGSDYWIAKLGEKLSGLQQANGSNGHGKLVVVTDVRFENEADFIRSRGGLLIRIERPMPADDNHASERQSESITVDMTVSNAGTPDDLLDRAEDILRVIRVREIKEKAL